MDFEILLAPPTKKAGHHAAVQDFNWQAKDQCIDSQAPTPLFSQQESGLGEGVQEHHLHATSSCK